MVRNLLVLSVWRQTSDKCKTALIPSGITCVEIVKGARASHGPHIGAAPAVGKVSELERLEVRTEMNFGERIGAEESVLDGRV
jgi:hypothetical protein